MPTEGAAHERLLGLLLVMAMVGCGGWVWWFLAAHRRCRLGKGAGIVITSNRDPIPALKKLEAYFWLNDQGEVVQIHDYGPKSTDAGLVHLKGLTNLHSLYLHESKITDAGVAERKKALPNCSIRK